MHSKACRRRFTKERRVSDRDRVNIKRLVVPAVRRRTGMQTGGLKYGHSQQAHEIDRKVVVLGQQGVGKSSLVLQYVHSVFQENGASTIGASFLAKKAVVDDTTVRLQVSCASKDRARLIHERFGILRVRNASGQWHLCIIVGLIVLFSVTILPLWTLSP